MAVYSFSQIQLYEQCPLKYRYKYIDKLDVQDYEETADLLLWKAVHYSLQKIYNDISWFKNTKLQDLLQYHDYYWKNNYNENVLIKWDSTLQDFKNRGYNYLSLYYDKYLTQSSSNIIATESALVFDLSSNIKFRWVIDRIDNHQGEFVINDYKTNKTLPPESKQQYVEQLSLYAIWLKQQYWKFIKNIKARLYYLHFDLVDEWQISEEYLNELISKYSSIIEKIQEAKFQYSMGDKSAFMTNESPLCNYCVFHSVCPLFAHLWYDDQVIDSLSDKTVKTLIDDYVETSKKITELQSQKDMYKDVLTKYLDWKELKVLYWNKSQIWISNIVNYSIKDKEKLLSLLDKLWFKNDVLDVDRFKLSKLIKDKKIQYSEYKDCVNQSNSLVFRWK